MDSVLGKRRKKKPTKQPESYLNNKEIPYKQKQKIFLF